MCTSQTMHRICLMFQFLVVLSYLLLTSQKQSPAFTYWRLERHKLCENKLSIKEVPIIFNERRLGKSKMSKRIVLEALLFLADNGVKRWLNIKIS